jgi:biopolymer transport protein ExbD
MNLRPRRPQQADINLTPLLDVVFLLLIFFMVSTTFKDEARLRIQLPAVQGEDAPAEEPETIRIVIDRTGSFFVNDRVVVDRRKITLVQALNGALGERKGLPVLIQADANTPHQAVMTALDAAAELGLVRIAFGATRQGAADESPAAASGAGEGGDGVLAAGATAGAAAPAGPAAKVEPPDLGPQAGGAGGADRVPLPLRPQGRTAPPSGARP